MVERKKKKGERADGRIQARVNIGRDVNGRIKYKYFYGKTIKEANQKADEYKNELANYGKALVSTKNLLSDWIYKHLFINVKPTVSASTFDRYMVMYNNHILNSSIGNSQIKEVEPLQLQEYFNSKKEYSRSYLKTLKNILNGAFESAIANNHIRINPVSSVKLPTLESKRTSVEILTPTQQKAYMGSLERYTHGIIFLLGLYTGMRIGELCALKWSNIDMDNCVIHVIESIKYIKNYNDDGTSSNMMVTKTPKTSKGTRDIPIPNTIVEKLIAYRKTSYKSDDDLVFCTKTGKPLLHFYVSKTHKAICKKAGIDEVTIHALRHTFATRCIENGIDVKTVSELLGHADVSITLSVYLHSTPETKKAAIDKLAKMYDNIAS